jgi:hypothetical protein
VTQPTHHRRWPALLAGCALLSTASAQVPPHRPGDICFTPSFWCWANPRGAAGKPCVCQTQFGAVRGTLR